MTCKNTHIRFEIRLKCDHFYSFKITVATASTCWSMVDSVEYTGGCQRENHFIVTCLFHCFHRATSLSDITKYTMLFHNSLRSSSLASYLHVQKRFTVTCYNRDSMKSTNNHDDVRTWKCLPCFDNPLPCQYVPLYSEAAVLPGMYIIDGLSLLIYFALNLT